MQVLRLLVARRVSRRGGGSDSNSPKTSTIRTAAVAASAFNGATRRATKPAQEDGEEDDDGPFFDIELSVPVYGSESQTTESGSESEDSRLTDLDFTISLERSRSASPSYDHLFFNGGGLLGCVDPGPIKFCASEPNTNPSSRHSKLRVLSFGSKKFAFYARDSFSRSSNSSRSARLFAGEFGFGMPAGSEQKKISGDVIRRYLRKISRRLRKVGPSDDVDAKSWSSSSKAFRLRKSPSASAAARSPPRRDDSLLEKQDGIASAIAHCKQSFHRGSTVSESDAMLVRSRSDPGKCEAGGSGGGV